MSNVGINIWNVGDALKNPELGGAIPTQQDTMPFSVGQLHVAGGDTDFAQAALNFGFAVAANDESAEAELSFELSVLGSDYAAGQAALVFDGFTVTADADGETPPNIQGGLIALRGVTVEGVGYTWGTGEAELEFPLYALGGDYDFGQAELQFGFTVSGIGQPQVLHGLAWIPGMAGYAASLMASEGLTISAASTLNAEMVLRTYLQIASDDAQILGNYLSDLDESLVIAVASSIPHTLQITESLLTASDHTFVVNKIIDLLDELALTVDGDMIGAYRLSFAHSILAASHSDIMDTMTVADVLQIAVDNPLQMTYVVDMLEALAAVHSGDHLGTFMVDMGENLEAAEAMDFLGAFKLSVEENLWPHVTFQIGDDVIQGWVMNTATQGFSEYQNYPFNSLAEANGRYYGLSRDGLYLLEGDDDAGEPIESVVRTGLVDMGSHYLKGAHAAYVGYTSTGQMVLKVATTDQGQKEEWWYELRPTTADDMRDGRVMLGRGLRARYWQFEIVNAAGADFDVDDVTLLYQVLNRRIR